jgi:hypothetical protein
MGVKLCSFVVLVYSIKQELVGNALFVVNMSKLVFFYTFVIL